MRERVAIVFMTLNVMATLVLGGAIAYDFAHRGSGTTAAPAAAGVAGQSYTSSPGGASGTAAPSGSAPTGTAAPAPTPASNASAPTGGSAPTAKASGTPAKAGGSAKSGGKNAGSGSTSTTESAQQGVNHGVITVGGIYDETGPIDATVERDTVRSYFNLVNAQGGVNGYKFQLIDCDSKYDPSSAHQCAQKLISQGVLAIVGWLSLSGEQNETPFLTSQGVPVIGGLGVPSEYK
jgi:ABC-type branched-subunit amino acid transport system substrate-binding protein